MRNPDLYAQLELIPLSELGSAESAQPELANSNAEDSNADAPASGFRRWASLGQFLRRAGRSLLREACGSAEPRIVTKRNPQGDLYFSVYDPISQQTHVFNSEQALRIWLDRRYYQ